MPEVSAPAHDGSAVPTVTTVPPPATPREPARAPADATIREPGRPQAQATPREPLRVEAVSREPARPKAEPPREATVGEKLRRDWGVIREHAERGGEEWRDGWRQIKSLFGQ